MPHARGSADRAFLPSRLFAAGVVCLVLAACSGPGEENCWSTSSDPEHLATRPSPLDSALVSLGDAQAKVCYSRPAARDRMVMGGLVRYGELWRLGANEATAVHLPFDATVGGVRLEPGSYSLYAVPDSASWTITLNRSWERWGIPVDSIVTVDDIESFTVPSEATDAHVEALTMAFETLDATEAELVVEWERTRVRIPVRRVEGGA